MSVKGPSGEEEARTLQRLVHSITDYAIYMMDTEGFIQTWNPGAERIKGYSRDEIVGAHFSRFFTEEDRLRGAPQQALAAARRDGRFESEAWRIRRDGSRFMALAVIDAVYDESGALIGFAKITRDITDRFNAQQALLESERRFRLLVQGVTDYAIYMLDPSGVIVNWNAGAERIKGYYADEVIGRHYSVFFPKDARNAGAPMRNLETALREGRYEAEERRVRKDGSEFWAHIIIDPVRNEKGELIGYAKVTRDITERRAAQHALRESERQFSMLVAGVVDYAIYMLDPSGVITSWNAGAEKIKGYTSDEVIGRHFSIFYTEGDRRAGLPARALHTALEEGKFESENWRTRKDGSLFWAHVVIDPIRDDDGNLMGYAKITRDVSERKNAQSQLAAAQSQLAHAQKMEALGQLTGGVAHDFNNLLMIVSGQAQLLRKRLKDQPQAMPALDAIQLAAKRGSDLTRQLLAFARRQPSNPEAISLKERAPAIQNMLGNALKENVQLTFSVPQEIWPMYVDPGEFELALVNLVVNARDAIGDHGEINVLAENTRISKGMLSDELEGDFVVVHVTDNGQGIPPDILPKVYDPFFTTKASGKGSGLGLAQVFGFIRNSGGDIRIHSEVGQGTRVSLYVPRATEAQRAGAEDAGDAAHADRPGRVLIVEDNSDVAAVTAAFLDQLGYQTTIRPNPEAALEILAAESFDLVVSDIVMAGEIDGVGLARRLKETRPDLPVLLVSGYSTAAERAGDEFPILRKPFELQELSRAISNLLLKAQASGAPNVVSLKSRRKD